MLAQKRRSKKGFFIFFFYFFFLFGFITLGFVWDYSKVITARHQAVIIADSLSMSGVTGVTSNTGNGNIVLDPNKARQRVNDTYFAALSNNVITNTLGPINRGVLIPNVPNTNISSNTVTVTVTYKVCGLYIIGILTDRSTCFQSSVASETQLCSSANNQDCAYPLRI